MAPRPVPWSKLVREHSFHLVLGACLALAGSVFFLLFNLSGDPVWDDWILDARGVRVVGQPTRVVATNREVNEHVVYDIQYSFEYPPGQRYRGASPARNTRALNRAEAGEPVTVEVDPQNPTRNRIAGTKASFYGVLAILALATVLVGAVFIMLGVLRALRQGLSSRRSP